MADDVEEMDIDLFASLDPDGEGVDIDLYASSDTDDDDNDDVEDDAVKEEQFVIAKVVDKRSVDGRTMYQVKWQQSWQGCDEGDYTWETQEQLIVKLANVDQLIDDFEIQQVLEQIDKLEAKQRETHAPNGQDQKRIQLTPPVRQQPPQL